MTATFSIKDSLRRSAPRPPLAVAGRQVPSGEMRAAVSVVTRLGVALTEEQMIACRVACWNLFYWDFANFATKGDSNG